MFWSKKQPQQQIVQVATKVKEEEKQDIIIPTIDIINQSKNEYLDLLEKELNSDESHTWKYLHVLERRGITDTKAIDVSFIAKARKHDFNLIVTPDIIQKFKYAAVAYGMYTSPIVIDPEDEDIFPKKSVIYVGDIPDFALDRIMNAQNNKLAYAITIHSNQKLPVIYEQYKYRDPVLISWNTNPTIK